MLGCALRDLGFVLLAVTSLGGASSCRTLQRHDGPSLGERPAPPAPAPATSAAPTPRAGPSPSAGDASLDGLHGLHGLGATADALAVVDDAHFWLLASGRAWRTRDGGETFVDRTPFAPAPAEPPDGERAGDVAVWSILATARTVSLLRGAPEDASFMTLFVSSNDGDSFLERGVPRLRYGRGAWLQKGASGSLLVMRSDGGGMNSHHTSILETRDLGASFHALGGVTGYGGVTFQTATTWWSVGTCCASASSIYRSADAGHTWSLFAEPEDGWEPTARVTFASPTAAYRVVRRGLELAVETTSDGARTWSAPPLPPRASELLEADDDACVLGGDEGAPLLASRDGGRSWTTLPSLPAGFGQPRTQRTPHGFLALGDVSGGSALVELRDGAASWRELGARLAAPPR